ncbi:MAG: metal ABC transporter permease [Deinococcota bacterium]
MTTLIAFLSDYTIQNVAMGAALLGISSGVLGCFAVLRQQSLLGDTLSHAALPGVCLGFMVAGSRQLGSILIGALITGTLAALFILLLTRRSRLKTDASLGAALSIFFAIGTVLLTYIQGTSNASQGGLNSFLFGQAAAILRSDLQVMAVITLLAVGLVALLWKELKLVTFDPIFAASVGLPVVVLEVVMTIMIALAVVIGLQMVGVVLMAAMIIAPAVAARQWVNSLGNMVTLAAVIGAGGGIIGALVSATGRNLATGPLIILGISAFVVISLLFAPQRGMVWELINHTKNRHILRTQQVLTTLYELSEKHGNPDYPTEEGMLTSYYQTNVSQELARLGQEGFIVPSKHMPEEGSHWVLTDHGRQEARRILASLNPQDQLDHPFEVSHAR